MPVVEGILKFDLSSLEDSAKRDRADVLSRILVIFSNLFIGVFCNVCYIMRIIVPTSKCFEGMIMCFLCFSASARQAYNFVIFSIVCFNTLCFLSLLNPCFGNVK